MNRFIIAILLGFCMLCFTPGISMADVVSHTGGPDDFGYQFIDNLGYGGFSYDMIDIHATGTSAGLHNKDDVFTGAHPIGFSFPFYGLRYAKFYVNCNGIITFKAGNDDYTNICLPSVNAPEEGIPLGMIAPYWDDLVTYAADSDVYYEYFEDSPHPDFSGPCLVVMWYKVQHYPGVTAQFSFEVILFANGEILMQYGPGNPEQGTGSTVGIQNKKGTIGLDYFCEYAGEPEPFFGGGTMESKSDNTDLVPSIIGPVPNNLAILYFGAPVPVDTGTYVTEDVSTEYDQNTENHKDKKFLENCFITVAASEASGLFPMLMALACALGGLVARKRIG